MIVGTALLFEKGDLMHIRKSIDPCQPAIGGTALLCEKGLNTFTKSIDPCQPAIMIGGTALLCDKEA